ncbi:PD40 domain-containing protein [Asticcacaulis sp. YBE204]|uniref:TolB family protein n=1 Tax=Asticcacaulis sp. YBE204 TaxID=1282363 RepID=UPI0003C3D16D|nr:PD40 domain-containing protein [Asticcacaulis sp. YBE204]ESQ79644.1 hypothetical protein AEYBE204_07320 [Asticcacaulis sp. YBE204]
MRSLLSALALCLLATTAHAEVGKRFAPEKRITIDRVTGRTLTLLTSGAVGDAKIYQTHPSWAQDGTHIVFRSSERAGSPQIFAVNEITGDIVQLTDGPGVDIGSINVARLTNTIYYLRRDGETLTLKVIDLTALLADSAAGKLKPEGYEKVIGTLPAGFINAGGFTLDADEKSAYFGFDQKKAPPRPQGGPVPQVPGGILAMDLATGKTREVVKSEFRMGHVQANPLKPGEILYCWETGGDAPQRMWIVNADGTGNREVFKEAADDWVTHEQFADADHVIFNLMGHTPKLAVRPTGLMVVNLRTGAVENLGQVPFTSKGRSFWHNGVAYDGSYAAADDFNGDLYLIDRKTGARTLLSTGHWMKPDHLHPSFSADNTRLLVQSGLLTDGKKLSLIVVSIK